VRTTSIYVTHDQMEAMTLADRIVLLRDGVIEQVGTPMELFSRPANRFVASFIGAPAMNILAGRIEGSEIVLPFLRLPCPPLVRAPADGRVEIGIRPEDVRPGGGFVAEAVVVEPMGSESLVLARAGGVDMQLRIAGRVPPLAGARLALAIEPEDLHVFDAATGVSLR
jgi:multiple sugar transport system ATP-binding protein